MWSPGEEEDRIKETKVFWRYIFGLTWTRSSLCPSSAPVWQQVGLVRESDTNYNLITY